MGAPAMIRAGVIDDVDIAIGAHIRPVQDIPAGKLCSAVRHASSTTVFVEVEGCGAHASMPDAGIDPVIDRLGDRHGASHASHEASRAQ